MQLDMFKEYSKSDKRLGDTNMSTLNYRTISDIYHNYSLSTANSNHKRAKVLGQFLTPWDIAENLASHTVEKLGEDITELIILDPFCGDGRMLLAMANTVLEKFGPKVNRISVVGFDVDPQAITSAKETLSILNDADKCGS